MRSPSHQKTMFQYGGNYYNSKKREAFKESKGILYN